MLINEKTTRSIHFVSASNEAYPIVRQLEKNNGQKSASKSNKMREKQMFGP